jgi:bifunctional DNA-binding transcriptional regulator/antitoxin component of YhaV-PrlF toxin-antitoxin module
MTQALKNRPPVVVPPAALRRAGFKRGQELEIKVSGGVISILPKLPAADDEYTPEQRRALDAELAAAEKGPFNGPFNTMDEMIEHLKGQLKQRRRIRKAKPSR